MSCHPSCGNTGLPAVPAPEFAPVACIGVSTAVAPDSALESVPVQKSDCMLHILTRRAFKSSATFQSGLGSTLGFIGHASAPLHIQFLNILSNMGIIGALIAGLIGGFIGGLIGNLGLLTDSSYTRESCLFCMHFWLICRHFCWDPNGIDQRAQNGPMVSIHGVVNSTRPWTLAVLQILYHLLSFS